MEYITKLTVWPLRLTPKPADAPPVTCFVCGQQKPASVAYSMLWGLYVCIDCDRLIQRRPGREIGAAMAKGLRELEKEKDRD